MAQGGPGGGLPLFPRCLQSLDVTTFRPLCLWAGEATVALMKGPHPSGWWPGLT